MPWRPRCSSAGTERCVRAEVYKTLGAEPAPLPGRTALIFDDGGWHEELTLDWLRKSVFQIHSEQMAVEPCVVSGSHDGYVCSVCSPRDADGRYIPEKIARVGRDVVHGHIDAMVTDPAGVDYLLEHKSASRFSFQRWSTGLEIPWDYMTQSGLYVHGLRLAGSHNVERALVIVKNKDTSAYLEFVMRAPTSIGPDEEPTVIEKLTVMEAERAIDVPILHGQRSRPRLLHDAVERFREIVRLRDAKTLPTRPFEFGHWRCDYCAFAATCWEDYSADAQRALAALAAPALVGADADLVRAVGNANAAATQSEKHAKELKARLKVRLMEMDLRAATVDDADGGWNVKLDMRSRTSLDPNLVPTPIRRQAETTKQFEILSVRRKKAR